MNDSPPPDSPEAEAAFSQVFRGLRERVFHGSNELVTRVMRGVEQQLQAVPEESLLGNLLVQLTNSVTAWFEPRPPSGLEGDSPHEQRPAAAHDDSTKAPKGDNS